MAGRVKLSFVDENDCHKQRKWLFADVMENRLSVQSQFKSSFCGFDLFYPKPLVSLSLSLCASFFLREVNLDISRVVN